MKFNECENDICQNEHVTLIHVLLFDSALLKYCIIIKLYHFI